MKLYEIYNIIFQKNEHKLREIVKVLFKAKSSPMYGAAKQIEHEVAAIETLKLLGSSKYKLYI